MGIHEGVEGYVNTGRETFGLLPEPDDRLSSFLGSLALNAGIGLLLFWVAMSQLRKSPEFARYVNTELIFPTRLPPSPRVKVLPLHVSAGLPLRTQIRRPQPDAPEPPAVHLNTPAMPAIPEMRARTVVAPPQPKVGLFASSKGFAVANEHSGAVIKTGTFGDPHGVTVNANATRSATIAAIGKFDSAPGTGQRAGAAHAGVVTTGGFGSGAATGVEGVAGGTGMGGGKVATGGFGGNGTGIRAVPEPSVQEAHFSPPEVLSEPRPQYTEEARQLRIQGEITLQVRFGIDGKVEVLRIVTGLGHGLDEQARLVAERIQFKPAVKDGQPTDQITYIHILFQLA
jgi:TonB family protein